jgi:hypothetical protein
MRIRGEHGSNRETPGCGERRFVLTYHVSALLNQDNAVMFHMPVVRGT